MTGMNWLWLVIGVVSGALVQRWLYRRQRLQSRSAESSVPQPGVMKPATKAVEMGHETSRRTSEVAPQEGDDGKLLWTAYVRALERAQFQGGFLARVAHELRSPLSSLMGLQQLILADLCDDPEEERQCVAQSYEAAQNLHSLMDQLIRVAKLEQGTQRLDIQPIALDVLLEDVESFVQLQVADRNARLQLKLPAQPVYAKADYNSLRQVLVMLVEAALSQKAYEIQVTLAPDDLGITINIWTDQSIVPLSELKAQLQNDSVDPWNQEALVQLQQSLQQKPGSSFVPHRLSTSMVWLVSQLMLDLNGGKLKLVPVSKESIPQSAQDEAATAEADSGLEQAYALELWLPSS